LEKTPNIAIFIGTIFSRKYYRDGVWRADYGKPMRIGHKQGKMRLTCFSKIGTALEAEHLFLLRYFHSEKQECRFLLLQCHAPPQEALPHPVNHWE
jgi:hypothetical protein